MNKRRNTAAGKQSDSETATGPPAAPQADQRTAGHRNQAHEAANTAEATGGPPPGLDAARHAAEQRTAYQAETLRKKVFPSLMAAALGLDNFVEGPAYQVYLEQVLADSGNPSDPIEAMLVEQLCLAHFRIGQLHGCASTAKALEAVKLYNTVSARMLGEFRRTALALRAYRSRTPEGKSDSRVKLFKMAQ